MNTTRPKIFCVGLSKTGTTSLARALEILGYRTRDYLGIKKYTPGDLSSIDLEVISNNDAFSDTPIPSFYKELDTEYPSSKFILTTRHMDEWLKSCKKQFTQKHAEKQNDAQRRLFMDLYQCNAFDEQKFRRGYESFINGVLLYFKDRPQDLLVFDVSAGDGWEKLSSFLGRPNPDVPFPRANVTQIRWMNPNEIVAIVQSAGQEALSVYEIIRGERSSLKKSKAGIFSTIGYILQKLRYRLHSDNAGALKTANKLYQRMILEHLKKLNPQIPIISPETCNDVPYSQRCKWNHLWLFNSLGDDKRKCGLVSTFTLSLALIEDRVPILGVVYIPGIDNIYYAVAGKGAFKVAGGKEPKALDMRGAASDGVPLSSNGAVFSPGNHAETRETIVNNTLAMCLAAEGERDIIPFLPDTTEWQTAAVNVVLNAVGVKVINSETKRELTYNKEDFANGCISLE